MPIDLFAFAQEHLLYEVQMFLEARSMRPVDQITMNIKVENFALHLKNLLEFFYPSSSDANNVVAANYIADWDEQRPAIAHRLEGARARAARELNHLTTQRIARTAVHKEWDFEGISEDLNRVVSRFIALEPKMPQVVISQLREVDPSGGF